MIQGLTEEGKKRYELVELYRLGEFYNPYMGNISIEDEAYTDEVKELVHTVLRGNPKWIMGCEWLDRDGDNYYVYLVPLEDLR